jgi:hypothetical protein
VTVKLPEQEPPTDGSKKEKKARALKPANEEAVTFYKSRGFAFTDASMQKLVRISPPPKKT